MILLRNKLCSSPNGSWPVSLVFMPISNDYFVNSANLTPPSHYLSLSQTHLYMNSLLHHSLILRTSSAPSRFALPPSSNSLSTMTSSSLTLPSISLQKLPFNASNSPRLGNGIRSLRPRNSDRSRVFMSLSVGSQALVNDALFSDYKPSCAFLFPGQVKF